MLNHRIRTTAVALAVMVGAAALPATSMATKNDGRFSRTQAARATGSATFCGDMQTLYQNDQDNVKAAVAANDYAAAFRAVDDGARDRATAHDYGCGWAWT